MFVEDARQIYTGLSCDVIASILSTSMAAQDDNKLVYFDVKIGDDERKLF